MNYSNQRNNLLEGTARQSIDCSEVRPLELANQAIPPKKRPQNINQNVIATTQQNTKQSVIAPTKQINNRIEFVPTFAAMINHELVFLQNSNNQIESSITKRVNTQVDFAALDASYQTSLPVYISKITKHFSIQTVTVEQYKNTKNLKDILRVSPNPRVDLSHKNWANIRSVLKLATAPQVKPVVVKQVLKIKNIQTLRPGFSKQKEIIHREPHNIIKEMIPLTYNKEENRITLFDDYAPSLHKEEYKPHYRHKIPRKVWKTNKHSKVDYGYCVFTQGDIEKHNEFLDKIERTKEEARLHREAQEENARLEDLMYEAAMSIELSDLMHLKRTDPDFYKRVMARRKEAQKRRKGYFDSPHESDSSSSAESEDTKASQLSDKALRERVKRKNLEEDLGELAKRQIAELDDQEFEELRVKLANRRAKKHIEKPQLTWFATFFTLAGISSLFTSAWEFTTASWSQAKTGVSYIWKRTKNFATNVKDTIDLPGRLSKFKAEFQWWKNFFYNFDPNNITDTMIKTMIEIKSLCCAAWYAYKGQFKEAANWASNLLITRCKEILNAMSFLSPAPLLRWFDDPISEVEVGGAKVTMNGEDFEATAKYHDAGGDPNILKRPGGSVSTEAGNEVINALVGAIAQSIVSDYDRDQVRALNDQFTFVNHTKRIADDNVKAAQTIMSVIARTLYGVDSFDRDYCAYVSKILTVCEFTKNEQLRAAELPAHKDRMSNIIKMYSRSTELGSHIRFNSIPKNLQVIYNRYFTILSELAKRSTMLLKGTENRDMPTFVLYTGPPGCGKSRMFEATEKAICERKGVELTKDMIYSRASGSLYWETYANQPFVHFDELWKEKKEDLKVVDSMAIIDCINTVTCPLNMAFDSKGSIFFDSPWVFGSTNLFNDGLLDKNYYLGIECPEAILRRIAINFHRDEVSEKDVMKNIYRINHCPAHPELVGTTVTAAEAIRLTLELRDEQLAEFKQNIVSQEEVHAAVEQARSLRDILRRTEEEIHTEGGKREEDEWVRMEPSAIITRSAELGVYSWLDSKNYPFYLALGGIIAGAVYWKEIYKYFYPEDAVVTEAKNASYDSQDSRTWHRRTKYKDRADYQPGFKAMSRRGNNVERTGDMFLQSGTLSFEKNLHNTLYYCMYHITAYGTYADATHKTVVGHVPAIHYGNRVIGVSGHWYLAFQECTQVTMKVVYKGVIYEAPLPDWYVPIPETDYFFMKLPESIPLAYNMLEYFIDEDHTYEVKSGHNMTMLSRRNAEGPVLRNLYKATYDDIIRYNKFGTTFTVVEPIGYFQKTEDGDSGSPICVSHPNGRAEIVGIHCGYKHNDPDKNTLRFAFPATRQLMTLGVEACEAHHENLKNKEEKKQDTKVEQVHTESGTVIPHKIKYTVPRELMSFPPKKSQIKHSKLFEYDFPAKQRPAKLHRFEKDGVIIDPWELGMSKMHQEKTVIEPIPASLDDYMVSCYGDGGGRVLNEDEAINGVPSLNIPSICMRSSPGNPFNNKPGRGKEPYLFPVTQPDKSIRFSYDPDFRKHLDSVHENLRKGIQMTCRWADNLKDERRSIEKAENGNTRLFTSCPLDYNILVRMYFLDFSRHVMTKCVTHPISVGINPHSMDWTRLHNRLKKHEGSVIAGDFKKFDGLLPSDLGRYFVDFVNRWYNDGPVNAKVRELLMEHVFSAEHIFYEFVYQVVDGNPSGNPMTSIYNSFVNQMMFFIVLTEDLKLDRTQFEMCLYGDDNLVTIAVPGITIDEVAKHFLRRFGMTLTHWTKGLSGSFETDTLYNVRFIGRRFAIRQSVVTAPLEKDVIIEALYWKKGSGPVDELMLASIESFLIEASHFNPVTFKMMVQDLITAMQQKERGIDHLVPAVKEMSYDYTFFHNRKYFPNTVEKIVTVQTKMNTTWKYVMKRRQPPPEVVENFINGPEVDMEFDGEVVNYTKDLQPFVIRHVHTESSLEDPYEEVAQDVIEFNIIWWTQFCIGYALTYLLLTKCVFPLVAHMTQRLDDVHLQSGMQVDPEAYFALHWDFEQGEEESIAQPSTPDERTYEEQEEYNHMITWEQYDNEPEEDEVWAEDLYDIEYDEGWHMTVPGDFGYQRLVQRYGPSAMFNAHYILRMGIPWEVRAVEARTFENRFTVQSALEEFDDPGWAHGHTRHLYVEDRVYGQSANDDPYAIYFICGLIGFAIGLLYNYWWNEYLILKEYESRLQEVDNMISAFETQFYRFTIMHPDDMIETIRTTLTSTVDYVRNDRVGLIAKVEQRKRHPVVGTIYKMQHLSKYIYDKVHTESGTADPNLTQTTTTRNEEFTDRAVNEVGETQAMQLGGFEDVSQVTSNMIDLPLQLVFRSTNMETFDLNGAFNRTFSLDTINWLGTSTTNTVLGTYSFPDVLFSQPFIADKLKDFQYFKASMRISFRVVCNRNLYGKLIAYFEPNLNQNLKPALTSRQASGNPHVLVSASASAAEIWDLPLVTYVRALDITNYQPGEWGTVKLRVLNSLRNTTTGTIEAQIYVTAQFVDAKAFLPHGQATSSKKKAKPKKSESFDIVETESGKGEANAKSSRGIISSMLESGATIASFVRSRRVQRYGRAVQTAAMVAGMAGLSKPPTMATTDTNKVDPFANLSNGRGISNARTLGNDPENAISTEPNVGGRSRDEMELAYIMQTPVLCSISDWVAGSTPATVMNAGPYDTGMTFVDFVCNNFGWWSGSYRVQIDVTASQFHQVRGVFWWSKTSDTDWQNCYHRFVEITGDCTFRWTLPYSQQHFASATNAGSNFGLQFAIIGFSVPDPSVSAPISLNVYKAAAPDFKVSGPLEKVYTVTQSNPQWDFANEEFPPFQDSIEEYETDKLLFGETVTTVRELLHQPQGILFNNVNNRATYYHYTPGAAGNQTLGINMWGQLFCWWRGSIRHNYTFRDANRFAAIYLSTPVGRIRGSYVSHPITGCLDVTAPYYYKELYQSTDVDSPNGFIIGTSSVYWVFESAGDDFSFHWLRSIPQGTFSDSTNYGNNQMINYYAVQTQPSVVATTSPVGFASLTKTAT